ncbi:amino acid adenylation domain protein [Nitrosococcus halophilus Nc 4]|uniref:Amino acid adenylation domain protein n=1 Tax=Nitrosococcus halophilus (strain Nc4) TaxID=472759 RepID=D5C316_NITHN|nr:non-ribosomal peptide synthetase [Nitrosococcus halophilus]ADE14908.1 amino acid adenylation domain protein [Nitrosococcus halophilus Nc 4]
MSLDKQALAQRFLALGDADQERFLAALREKSLRFDRLPIVKGKRSNRAPLAPAQRRLWLLHQMEPDNSAYHMVGAFELSGVVQSEALRGALADIQRRHEALRTRFVEIDGEPWQVIDEHPPLALTEQDMTDADSSTIEHLADDHAQAGFDLSRGPLLRIQLLRLTSQRWRLQVVMHHIISDGWSIGIFFKELEQAWRTRQAGNTEGLPALAVQYADYAIWQRAWLNAGERERQLAYWRDQLEPGQPPLLLPYDTPVADSDLRQAAAERLSLPVSLVTALRMLARECDATLFTVLLAAWQWALAVQSGRRDIPVGVPVANRNRPEIAPLIGFFVNTLVLRGQPDPAASVRDWVRQLHTRMLDAQDHQALPFDQLVEAIAPRRKPGETPLFQVLFNYQRRDAQAFEVLPGVTLRPLSQGVPHALFDLALDADEQADGQVSLTLTYAADRFKADTISRLLSMLEQALSGFTQDAQRPLGSLELLTPEQRERLKLWSGGSEAYGRGVTLAGLISAQAARRPESEALVSGEERVSYGELESRSERLGRWLRSQGVSAETVVGVLLERGVGMIESFLGILKAGGAFLPLDPDYPEERLGYMLRDSGVELLLSESGLAGRLPAVEGLRVVALDRLDYGAEESGDLAVPVHPEQLAYVIYTSGSTGQPKGVGVTQGGLSMHVQSIGERYGMGPEDVELHFASISFDGAVERWAVPLAFGSRLVIRDQGLWSAERTCQVLEEEGVTIACFPPSYVGPLLDWIEHRRPQLKVRSWTLGGEAFTRELYERLQRVLKPRRVLNGYGPTETVVTPLLWEADEGTAMSSAYAPIGTAVGARRLYVLDGELNRVPPGVSGELYIGGEVGLARGYWGRAGQTAERFLPDRWGAPGERMYRTGDWVRWRADGVVEYLGRVDGQVKLRGFRIELGEIETRLLALAQVREAVVVMRRGPGGERLVGYVAAPPEVEGERLRAALAGQLPEYMVPSQVVRLEALPLTPAGKVDRQGLPEPRWSAEGYEPPQTEAEAVLAQVWGQLLGVERVGRQDRFFELGGDSIIALQVVSRARQAGWSLRPRDLFEQPTLSALAAVVQPAKASNAVQESLVGPLPLTPIQSHFFELQPPVPSHWNQHLWLALKVPLDVTALSAALQALMRHHDALRLHFRQQGGQWQQSFVDPAELNSELLWVRAAEGEEEVERWCNEVQRSLDIETGELLRALYVSSPSQPDRLLLCIHHLAVDGVSWRILLEDLLRAYQQYLAGEAIELPAKTHSLRDWSQALSAWAKTAQAESRLPFWQQQFTETTSCRTPFAKCGHWTMMLSKAETQKLLYQAPAQLDVNVPALLVTALVQVLADERQPRIAVNLEGHGRTEEVTPHLDVSRTVGWFTSFYPVALEWQPDLQRCMAGVAEQLRRADQDGGISYGALRYQGHESSRRQLAGAAAAPVTFNYLGQYRSDGLEHWFSPLPGGGDPQAPENPMAAPLSVNAQVVAGQLSLDWLYSQDHYNPLQIKQLAQCYKQVLLTLLETPVSNVPAAADPRLLVPLAEASLEQPPVFCIHPVTGRVNGYQPLAMGLQGHRTLIGLQSRSFVDTLWFDPSLSQMADRYVATLRYRQPVGPYYLLGWSLGGALAMEIACRLEQAGEGIAFLGLLDSYVPGFEIPEDQWTSPQAQQKLADHLRILLPGVAEEGLQHCLAQFSESQPRQWPEIFSAWLSTQGVDAVSAENAQQLLFSWALEQHYRRLCDGYTLPSVSTKAHAWWAGKPEGRGQQLQQALQEKVRLTFSRIVAADHLSIVRDAECLSDLHESLRI